MKRFGYSSYLSVIMSYLGVIIGLSTTGCAGPRIVQFDQTSVIIAVPEDSDEFPHYYKSEATKLAKSKVPDAEFVDSIRVKEGKLKETIGSGGIKPGEVRPGEVATSTSDKVEYYLEYRSKATLSPLSTKPLIRVGTGDPNIKADLTTLPPTPIGESKTPEQSKTPERRTVPPITNPSPIQNNFPNTALPR